jgi:hypothetical protein
MTTEEQTARLDREWMKRNDGRAPTLHVGSPAARALRWVLEMDAELQAKIEALTTAEVRIHDLEEKAKLEAGVLEQHKAADGELRAKLDAQEPVMEAARQAVQAYGRVSGTCHGQGLHPVRHDEDQQRELARAVAKLPRV